MLGPLFAPWSRFLELLVVIDAWSFDSLWLPDAVRRVIYAPIASSREVALVDQSRPELLWPVDIILRAGGNAVFSGRWRAYALGHRLRIGDHLAFRRRLHRPPHLRLARGAVKGRPCHGSLLGRGASLLPSFAM
jgi:hypothetical protein